MLPFITRLTGFSTGMPVDKLYSKFKTKESAILDIEGMPVHYRVTGQGPSLLLLHGVSSSLHTWNDWHQELSNDFRVISFDLPSFGLTGPHPDNNYKTEMYLGVIDQLLDHLSVEKTYMAGNSFGGFLTWNYALHRPEKLIKIALLNAAGIAYEKSSMHDFRFQLFLNPITKHLAHYASPRFMIKQSIANVYGDQSKITDELVDRYHQLFLRTGNRKGFSEVLGKTILDGKDKTAAIKKVVVPTLILWGDKDNLIAVEDAYSFNELIEDSALIVYKGVGHVPMEEIPNQSAEDTKKFFLNS